MATCTHCGQPIFDLASIPERAGLSPREGDLFRAIAAAGGRPVSAHAIFDAIYRDDPEGGPLFSTHVIRTLVYRANNKLTAFPYQIRNNRGFGYRLVAPKRSA